MGCNLSYMRRRMQLGAQPHKAKASGAVATFRTNLAAKLDSLFVDVTPVQDLHGQAYPYPPGGGKNLFQTTAVTDTKNGTKFTINTDGSVTISGTPTSNITYTLGSVVLPAGTYKVNGCAGGSTSTYRMACYNVTESSTIASIYGGADTQFTLANEAEVRLYPVVLTGFDGSAVTIYPMIRLASITDATFAPYSNVCPITGCAEANVTGCGVNLVEDSIPNKNISSYGKITNSSTNSLFLARVKKGVTYTFSQSGALCYAYFTDKPEDDATSYNGERYTTGGTTVIAPIDGWIAFRGGNDFETPMIVVGDTLPAYTPYVGTTAVIQFGQTLYGARIDWKGRKAVVTHKLVTFTGAQGEGWNANQGNGYFVSASNLGCGVAHTPISNYVKGIVPGQGSQLHDWEMRINTQFVNLIVKPPMSVFDTLQKWKGYLDENPLQVLMQLATPVEIPLDLVDFVTVPGINNVFADCGNVDLSYWTNV